jgi:hypothetical protein
MAKAPVNVVVQGATPVAKMPAELLTRRQLFPDAFKPSTIRDRGYYLAKSFGIENEYAALAGLPSEGYGKSIEKFLVYTQDPRKNAYGDILTAKSRFLQKIGKGGDVMFISPRSNALYNYKLALRFGDKAAQKKYLAEYQLLGGTREGMASSLKAMNPLSGLSRQEAKAFIVSLGTDDRRKLMLALRFYADVLTGGTQGSNLLDDLPPQKREGGVLWR